jgi:hypothetical protein
MYVGFVVDKMAQVWVLSLSTWIFSPFSMIPASSVLAVAHNISYYGARVYYMLSAHL